MKRWLVIDGLLIFVCSITFSQRAIFLHHSTGGNVFYQGEVTSWISEYNSNNGTDFQVDERAYPTDPYPWNNYPFDYWNLWINNVCDNSDIDIECLDKITQDYDMVIFKHCFPGAQINPDDGDPSVSSEYKSLANYKLQYRALRALMDSYPENKFVIWTLVPLHRLATNHENAARAREFVDWVKTTWLLEDEIPHPNIYVFDFFGYSAENNSDPAEGKVNCLKFEYEISHETNDSHPNLTANQTIGPLFAQFIVDAFEDTSKNEVLVTSIQVSSEGGLTEIDTGDSIKFFVEVLPEDATNKEITWDITDGSGSAAITQEGLLTALGEGSVTVVATAQDGSQVSGNMQISINDSSTGINYADYKEINVMPNPFSGRFFVTSPAADINMIQIVGNSGSVTWTYLPEPGNSVIPIDISDHPPGLYCIKISLKEKTIIKRAILAR